MNKIIKILDIAPTSGHYPDWQNNKSYFVRPILLHNEWTHYPLLLFGNNRYKTIEGVFLEDDSYIFINGVKYEEYEEAKLKPIWKI